MISDIFSTFETKPFEIYWEPPQGIEIEDPCLPEPRHEMRLEEVGVENIVDAVKLSVEGLKINVRFDNILEKLIPEQRQVIVAHLAHILNKYMGRENTCFKDYIVKAKFHLHVQRLADLEGEPGEYESY